MSNQRIINTFFIVIIGVTLGFHFFFDLKFKTQIVRTGDFRLPAAEKPFYGILHVPGTSPPPRRPEEVQHLRFWQTLNMFDPDQRPRMLGALGSDFAQVYYAAKALHHGESQYAPRSREFRDPFDRKPNYPPFTNRL